MKMEREYNLAILMVEDEEGAREPVGIVTTRREADALATEDLKERKRVLDQDGDPGLCPYLYQVWSYGMHGYRKIEEWAP